MKKAVVLGHFGFGHDKSNGQTIKTKIVKHIAIFNAGIPVGRMAMTYDCDSVIYSVGIVYYFTFAVIQAGQNNALKWLFNVSLYLLMLFKFI